MKKLLSHINIPSNNNIEYIILLLIHELRIVTVEQLFQLMKLDLVISKKVIYNNTHRLYESELIDFINVKDGKRINKCYYLTRLGHQSIGGNYTLPRVPEYNLNHHLEVTNYLIKSLKQVNDLEHFLMAISERRQVYENKDMNNKKQKGISLHVADYVLKFQDPSASQYSSIEWQFEIELTLKSKRRYIYGIFPKYIKLLSQYENYRLFYVTPSPTIERELDLFKEHYIQKKRQGELEHINMNVFQRLHIIPANNFEPVLEKAIQKTFMKEGNEND